MEVLAHSGVGLLGALILAVLWLALQVAQLRTQLLPFTSSRLALGIAGAS